ncbi:MAG TPA: aminotransferase class I/II-fold pyridoxal phosphate-dependent enzyme [Salinivirga sp.]|uniref:aminotransferase class I/II-fold pyridoxal phosphate-dependent enzyme n=1 Tax=Salinivirga sp. TaxID=1970192 RepID=UPI002B47F94E|nr:aminotransferase class I/II-fold pyridoxal phosphate-dependent enzyme [Salinivirga sp.]HKK58848.1 aminotransferase class I/II-fold pyridoxal phosphate-dependent enzyme [Salinivirga sp.]
MLTKNVDELEKSGRAKGAEKVITQCIPAQKGKGPRYLLEGYGNKEFIRMNSNSYLGLSLRKDMIEAEEKGAAEFGVGPGAVRFINGTFKSHLDLEAKLAAFHGREAGMIFSSAYVTSIGVIFPMTTKETVLISDELNHNCIINAMRLGRPAGKEIYAHNNMEALEKALERSIGKGKRALVITDGIFSMRGDHAPLDEFVKVCEKFNDKFEEGVITIADDSHGVGAFGKTGRGTEEYTNAKVDILVGTLGKAFGVNGGYVVSSKEVVKYLRESAPTYIYSNPITVSESEAAIKALEIVDTSEGKDILAHLRAMTQKFDKGLCDLGLETIEGDHPVVPLMVRDSQKTSDIVKHLNEHGVLATGLNFPVVPKGDEEIRFQINASHTEKDIDIVLEVLSNYKD